MQRRKHVQMFWRDKSGRLGSGPCLDFRDCPSARVNGLNQAWITDCHMNEPRRWIEECGIRHAGQRPFVKRSSSECVDFDERAAVARNVEEVSLSIDVEPVCSG